MKTPLIAALIAAAAASAALPAAAQVEGRQDVQAARIDQGVRSGQLTRHETRHLERQQARIARTEARMRSHHDGALTPHDHRVLARQQNHADRSIRRAKHNDRVG